MSANLSLEFANTADWHAGSAPEERLQSYALAVAWAQDHGILSDMQAAGLVERARSRPNEEAMALGRVIALREGVYRVFSAVAHRRSPELADLQLLDRESREASAHLRLVLVPEGSEGTEESSGDLPRFEWTWFGIEGELTGFLWPIARAATELLTSKQLAQVRECAGDPCGWLFLDLSKNGSRRWCDMADCGNRAKARRYRARKKEMPAATTSTDNAAESAIRT
jgi:predicted RNA-binding Zn ribbon-like protein